MGIFGGAEEQIRRQVNDRLQRHHALQLQQLQRINGRTELIIRRHKKEKHTQKNKRYKQ